MFEKIKNIFKKEDEDVVKIAQELDERQKIINEKYEKEGLTDEVLDLQIKLNQDRNKHNISDPTKRIYENFVQ